MIEWMQVLMELVDFGEIIPDEAVFLRWPGDEK